MHRNFFSPPSLFLLSLLLVSLSFNGGLRFFSSLPSLPHVSLRVLALQASQRRLGEQKKGVVNGEERKGFYREEDFCSNGLRDAINAAILELGGEHYVDRVLLQKYTSVPYIPLLTCPVSVKTSDSANLPQVVSSPAPKTVSFQQAHNDLRKAIVNALHASSSSSKTPLSSDSPGTSSKDKNADGNSDQQKKKSSGMTTSPSSSSLWPDLQTLHEKDLLFDVIKKGVLTVAGLGPRIDPERDNERSFRQYYLSQVLMNKKSKEKTDGGDISDSSSGFSSTDWRRSSSSSRGEGGDLPPQQEEEEEQGGDEEDLRRQQEKEELFFSQTSRGFNWGEEGDYSKQPPQGYFPEYLRAIVARIGEHYKVNSPIKINYLYFSNGGDCMRSVKTGVAHMTDIYFILAYQQGSSSHLTDFYRTCPVSGSPNNFLTLKEYNIESLQDLSRTLRMATSAEMRTIAYLSTGNYETIHFFFPSQTLGEVMTKEEAERRILSREILGNIRTGSGGAGMSPKLEVVDLGLILGQGPWLKRTDTTHCLYHQLIGRQLAKDQHQQNLSFLTKLQMEVDLQQDAKKAKARSSSSSSSSAASSSIFAKQGGGALLFLFVSSLTMYMM